MPFDSRHNPPKPPKKVVKGGTLTLQPTAQLYAAQGKHVRTSIKNYEKFFIGAHIKQRERKKQTQITDQQKPNTPSQAPKNLKNVSKHSAF